MTDRNGQCLCGAVKIAVRDVPRDFGACHCNMCRRWTGSALLAVTVPEATVRWQGEEHIRRIQSSPWAERAWCDCCGTGLWYRVTAEGPHKGNYELPIGLFDDANGMQMTSEIYIDLKSDAFAYAGERKRYTEAETLALFGIEEGAE
ncbi:GFA family protein [Pseudodonghicola flavimaris]|uniref:GFA family protein n=1 Tax=Pseudodonghicola flavimaris TaxID=3050036 RepID=A0ABT7EZM1_9RHOB|nr:GFA family protein [Pseudodonghicola flavimaris]MDK3017787.1 GFA family protein [Pseudodonghicola flavimaris]